MDDARFRIVKSIFQRVYALPDADRGRFVADACGADAELRREVEDLLARSSAAERRFPGVRPVVPRRGNHSSLEIEGFRLHSTLGVGSSGIVYRAEQLVPRREVALKVLRLDSLGPGQVARFRREAEILAALHHPGIAQVFGAGVTDEGSLALPWIAMELVRGVPIDEWVEVAKPAWRELLVLFLDVCAAVEHAHECGVVHRDLKPSNVLIDERGRPRILDFGVARAAIEARPASEVHTRTGTLIGTLAYMSPEQARGAHDALSPASDVYSLGVLLFELLSHRLPLDVVELDLGSAIRVIETTDPERLRTLRPDVPRDLDTIVRKALEKDPTRRYPRAGALASDVANLLEARPISARAPTATYQLSMFVRRNRGVTVGTAAVIVALTLGLSIALLSLRRERAQRAETSATLDFFARRVVASSPHLGSGETQRSEMEEVAARLRRQIEVDPASGLRASLAQVLYELGCLDQSLRDHAALRARAIEAHALRSQLVQEDPSDVASWCQLSALCAKLGEAERDLGNRAGRDHWFARALAIDERLVHEHPDDPEFVEDLGWSLARIAFALASDGRYDEAARWNERRFRDAERLVAREPGNWKYALNLSHAHAVLAEEYRRYDCRAEATEHARECLRLARRASQLDPERRDLMTWLVDAGRNAAVLIAEQGSAAEAWALFMETFARVEQVCVSDPYRQEHLDAVLTVVNDVRRSAPVEHRARLDRVCSELLRRVAGPVALAGMEERARQFLALADDIDASS